MATEAFTTPTTAAPRRAGTPLVQAFWRWYVARQTRRALNQLSVRQLADVGITPDQIDQIAERVARQ